MASIGRIISELERILKNVLFFEIVSRDSLGGAEEVHERPLAEIRLTYVPSTALQQLLRKFWCFILTKNICSFRNFTGFWGCVKPVKCLVDVVVQQHCAEALRH